MPKHEEGIKFDRSQGSPRELSAEVLVAFAANRREQISDLDAQLRSYAEQIRDLIPESLKVFASESHLAQVDELMKLLGTFGSTNEYEPYSILSAKLKEPETYGFNDKEDAYQGMLVLKRAWLGILDVQISKNDGYVEVSVRGIKEGANR